MSSQQDKEEDHILEYNSNQGLLAAFFYWFARRLALPLFLVMIFIVVTTFVRNGMMAGLMSLLIVSVPFGLLLWFTRWQSAKVTEFFQK